MCLAMNFIKICPEIALKYFFEKNVVLYEIYSKKSKVTNTYVHRLDIYHSLQIIIATRLQWSNFNRSKTLATTQLEALKQVFLSGLTFNMYSSQKFLIYCIFYCNCDFCISTTVQYKWCTWKSIFETTLDLGFK